MQNLLQTHSVSWAHSVILALQGEGIEAVLLDEFQPGYLGFAGQVRVAVVNDEELPRARAIVAAMDPARSPWH